MIIDLTEAEIQQIRKTTNTKIKEAQKSIKKQLEYEKDAPQRAAIRQALDAGIIGSLYQTCQQITVYDTYAILFERLHVGSGTYLYKNKIYTITYIPSGGVGMGEYPCRWHILPDANRTYINLDEEVGN